MTSMAVDRVTEVYEGTASSARHTEVVRRRVHWMCSECAGSQVLDVGCSQGITSLILAREGKQVIGVDRDLEALEFARDRLLDEDPVVQSRASFVFGEASSLPFDDHQFDTVVLGEILEHQVDSAPLLEEAARVLRPGGSLVITTPYGLHDFPDHKDPIYLGALLSQLSARYKVSKLELVDRYIAVVGQARKRIGRAPGASLWGDALALAEGRLAEQDRAVAAQHRKLATLYEERDKVLAARGDLDVLKAEKEAAETRAAALEAHNIDLRARVSGMQQQLKELRAHLAARDEQVGTLKEQAGALKELQAKLQESLASLKFDKEQHEAVLAELDSTQAQLARRADQLDAVLSSRSYRFVRQLWRIRRLGRKPRPALPAGRD